MTPFSKKFSKFLFILFLSVAIFLFLKNSVKADECSNVQGLNLEQITGCIGNYQNVFGMISKANQTNKSNLNSLNNQIVSLKKQIDALSFQITKKEEDINKRNKEFDKEYEKLSVAVKNYYVQSYYPTNLLILFNSNNAEDTVRQMQTFSMLSKKNRNNIAQLVESIGNLQKEKKQLEGIIVNTSSLKKQVDEKAAFLQKEVEKANVYEQQLQSTIAKLSARQQEIIAQRQSSLNLPTSLGAGPLYCTDDRKLDPGFSPAYAFFTFGIPHRVGLNQYGAYGRAKAGQNYKDILQAYFQNISIEKKDNINIKVQGYGEMPLETYLLGIYEMPGSWPIEALKSQVVAARSYARSYTNNGAKEICTTQSCQVYKGGNKGGDWERAVKETEGEVLVNNGNVVTAWYASTSGGYTFTSSDVGWGDRPWTKRLRDTTSNVSNINDLMNNAYDKDSPCFYSAQGFRTEYAKSAWLKESEVADIVNVVQLMKRDGGVSSHVYQVDKPNPEGQETWSFDKVKSELRSRGGQVFNSISGISLDFDFGSGVVNNITINGDGGSITFSGGEFKNFFNLRAPANIQIVGPLFNVEKK